MQGNSLEFYDVKGMTAGNIGNFQKLVFKYDSMQAGDVILELTGLGDYNEESGSVEAMPTSIAGADVSVSVVNLYGKDGGEFKKGDKIVLLKNDDYGIDTDG